ncbi:sugar transferase [Candidatus Uabimicrobium sp. HlEnr_7]|uniref:sugar transferase n=1 Tax=Candidatus Uabimicrobium helgolandensis TaxID=3095367 RepID=UPI0035569E86
MFYYKMKRILDFCAASILLLALLPFMLILMILIYIAMGSPVIFSQKRVGFHSRIFTIYKFRTMRNNQEREPLPDKDRLTRLGKWIRKFSLDELPQLYNIIKGDMSFIGPRPLLVEYLPLYSKEQLHRHDVRPGITGWAQVNGRNLLTWEQKFNLDLHYVRHMSLLLDCKIFLFTFVVIFKAKGVNQSSSIIMDRFTGNE